MKARNIILTVMLTAVPAIMMAQGATADASSSAAVDSTLNVLGVNLFEESIDRVIFQTNQFVSSVTFIGGGGPFWWILQMCMGLGALFSIIAAAGMAYKMMLKNEPFEPMKLLRIAAIALIMFWWYPNTNPFRTSWCFLDFLAYIPNCIGSYTHDLYAIEADQVQDKFKQMTTLMQQRDNAVQAAADKYKGASEQLQNSLNNDGKVDASVLDEANATKGTLDSMYNMAMYAKTRVQIAGFSIGLDKLLVFIAVLLFRIGWWGTIYCQQVILGMLTIFGPLQWAFSVLPKWEGAWAKWLIRYLTVHLYGAMLYFVGFYVLLLFDIVLSIQIDDLNAVVSTNGGVGAFLRNSFITAGYLLVSSVVSLKCLNLVPDLAAWMIPEGEASYSTRNFGEGVSSQVNQQGKAIVQPGIGLLK